MTKIETGATILLTVFGILFASMFFVIPKSASAAEVSALGGTVFTRTAPAGIMPRVTVNVRGGSPDQTSSGQNSSGGNTTSASDGGAGGNGGNTPGGSNVQSNPPANTSGAGGTNGGASAGNGGQGGNSSPGGLVRAGNVASSANSLNVINLNIVRISTR